MTSAKDVTGTPPETPNRSNRSTVETATTQLSNLTLELSPPVTPTPTRVAENESTTTDGTNRPSLNMMSNDSATSTHSIPVIQTSGPHFSSHHMGIAPIMTPTTPAGYPYFDPTMATSPFSFFNGAPTPQSLGLPFSPIIEDKMASHSASGGTTPVIVTPSAQFPPPSPFWNWQQSNQNRASSSTFSSLNFPTDLMSPSHSFAIPFPAGNSGRMSFTPTFSMDASGMPGVAPGLMSPLASPFGAHHVQHHHDPATQRPHSHSSFLESSSANPAAPRTHTSLMGAKESKPKQHAGVSSGKKPNIRKAIFNDESSNRRPKRKHQQNGGNGKRHHNQRNYQPKRHNNHRHNNRNHNHNHMPMQTPMHDGLTLSEIISQNFALDMALDQDGSRFFQKTFPASTFAEKTALFACLRPHVLELTNHVFGNWVIQLFFDYGDHVHMCHVVESFRDNVLAISMNTYGCRVIQKALRSSSEYLQIAILDEMKGHVAQCIVDTNAHHVIEKSIVDAKQHVTQFIVDEIAPMTLTFACHAYGCQIIERILYNYDDRPNENLDMLIREIADNCVDLSLHKFGNYIVQDVLVRVSEDVRDGMIKKMWENIGILSRDKYASNVIEKCVKSASKRRNRKLFKKLVGFDSPQSKPKSKSSSKSKSKSKSKHSNYDPSTIANMIEDKFGNYVIQTLYSCLSQSDANMFYERISRIVDLNKTNYGRHILNAIRKTQQQQQHDRQMKPKKRRVRDQIEGDLEGSEETNETTTTDSQEEEDAAPKTRSPDRAARSASKSKKSSPQRKNIDKSAHVSQIASDDDAT